MSLGPVFTLRGSIMPVPGPGFSTPTFQRGNGNGLWIQDIDASDRAAGFLELQPRHVEESRELDTERLQREGDPAIYVFHGRDNQYVDTRSRLNDALRYEYELLGDFPYLRRSIGRFVGDDALVRKAEAQIAAWNRATPSFGPQPWSDVRERFVRRGLFEEFADKAKSGVPLAIHGRRGSGKSLLMAWLAEELDHAGRAVFQVPVRINNSIVPALFELGAVMPEWTLEARDSARAHKALVRAQKPTAEMDAEIVARFSAACTAARRPVTLLVDDFDISLGDPAAEAGNRALLALTRASPAVQLIVAMSRFEAVAHHGDMFQEGSDFLRVELPDLDRSEVEALFRKIGDPSRGDLDDLERTALARQLSGFNFRETLEIFSQLAGNRDRSERTVRAIVAKQCERTFHLLREYTPEVGVVLGSVSGAAPVRDFAKLIAEGERNPAIRRGLQVAVQNGLIEMTPDAGIRFRHRYIRDWWEGRAKDKPQ